MAKSTFTVDRGKLEVRMSRVFDAPPERLQQAYTDPAQIPRWWGPREYSTRVDKMDVRVDGGWRFLQVDEDGNIYAFHGEYQEVLPTRLTSTFEFEAMAGHVILDTALFDALPDGRTRLTAISRYASLDDLDGMVGSGMEEGATESWDRLAELVEQPRKGGQVEIGA